MKITLSAIVLALTAASIAQGKGTSKGNNTSDIKRLIQYIKDTDPQGARLRKPDMTEAELCKARQENSGNRYRTDFTQDGVKYEIIYTDLGSKDGGNCVIDAVDNLVLNVNYGGENSSGTSKEFTDDGIDGIFAKSSDKASFVGYPESITPADKKQIEDVLNGRESTYRMGFEYDGQELGVNGQKIVMKEYLKHIAGAVKHYKPKQVRKR